jgi:zinc dependent phospholipase C
MPQPSYHLQHSREILDSWTENPTASPFDSKSPANRAAFLHGSLGPDMGFFSGAAEFLARLSHRSPTGDFARELLRHAHSDAQIAFAFGWVTHILLDSMMHPLINSAAAQRLGLDPETAPLSELEHTHIRFEIGLDLAVHRRHTRLHRLRLDPAFDAHSLGFLSQTLGVIHGVSVSGAELDIVHRRVCQVLGPMLTLQATMSYARLDGALGAVTPAVWSARAGLGTLHAVASRVKGAHSKTAAFLTPLHADTDLLQKIGDAVARFRWEFQSHVTSGLATLPNYHVDSGRIDNGRYSESAA